MDKDFLRNFGMIIPQGSFVTHKPKPISRWKKVVCFLIGHKWIDAGITYTGPGFPRKCSRCKKDRWFHKPNLRMCLNKWVNKALDKVWMPLCKIQIHRWRFHYAFFSFSYGGNPAPAIHQHIYKCSCCKKTKTVKI